MTARRRVAVLATHPIHYQVQLFKRLGRARGLDVTMLFCSRFGLSRQVDHTFGVAHQWYDESILEGLDNKFLANYSWERTPSSIFGTISPGILAELTRARYDVLLVQGYAGVTEWLALVAARAGRCRLLFRGETVPRPRSTRGRDAARWMVMRALARAVDVFLPIGTRSREFYLHYGIGADRLVLSPYSVDNEFFFARARELGNRKAEIRRSLGLSPEVPVVLYVSKMTPRKRPLDLVAAFERVRTPAVLLFVGDGPLRAEIESQAARRGMRNVLCSGFQRQEDLPRFYAAGDVFVLPSEFEPWGLVVNEAMCFSLPIVTTRGVSASADLVVHGENGLLYDAGDVEALGGHLEALVGDAARRAAMGRRSSEIVRRWDHQASIDGICRGISLALGDERVSGQGRDDGQ